LLIRHEGGDLFSEFNPVRLQRVVPGDIFYYRPGHIAVVQEVVFGKDSGLVTNVRLIESTYSMNIKRPIANVRSVALLASDYLDKTYQLVRLRGVGK